MLRRLLLPTQESSVQGTSSRPSPGMAWVPMACWQEAIRASTSWGASPAQNCDKTHNFHFVRPAAPIRGGGSSSEGPLPWSLLQPLSLPAWLETWLRERTRTRTKKWKERGSLDENKLGENATRRPKSREHTVLCKTHRTQRQKHYRSGARRGLRAVLPPRTTPHF